ncbi:holo-ACP synthase [uncultured Helicobacter sp.]|uniref:holo-ACP synthase n=1 Tax=uncultured Helicobacter sp. TaxID=175537 RepID=UPI001C3B9862|nr:holo-ACP synthase [Candidatus Helicobacter avicola]
MLGIDVVRISRLEDLTQRFGTKGLERFLHQDEIELCQRQNAYNYARIAGFWAAKEALSKALGCGIGTEIGFLDMSITLDSKGAPHIALDSQKMSYFQAKKSFAHIALSITHDADIAIACVALR